MIAWTKEVERDLIKEAKKDPTNFGVVYDHYFDRIYRYIALKVSYTDLAKDITANTFFKAISKLHQYNEDQKTFSAWLYKIALNEIRLHYRKSKRENFVFNSNDLVTALDIRRSDGEDYDLHEELESALLTLNEVDLTLLELRYYESMSFRALGELLQISEEAAKMRTHRVVAKLRERFKKVIA